MVCHKEYYKGEGGGFPQVQGVMTLLNPCKPVARLCTKSVPTMHYLTCCLVLCKSIWMIDLLVICPNPHLVAPARLFYPQSAMSQRPYPNFFYFHCFHFGTCIWVFQRVWGCAIQILFPLVTQSTCYSISNFFLKILLVKFYFFRFFL